MATATPRIVVKEVTTKVTSKDGVALNLSDVEAQTLLDICEMVGGSPHKSRRAHADAIATALRSAGYRSPNGVCPDVEPRRNSIYFTEKE